MKLSLEPITARLEPPRQENHRILAKRRTVHAVISQGDHLYVAECLELPVATQGLTVDETVSSLREAVALHLEDENLDDLGLAASPTISVTLELEPISAPLRVLSGDDVPRRPR